VKTFAFRSCARSLRRAACAASLVTALTFFAVPGAAFAAMGPADGAWFIDGTGVAVQLFDCSGLLCGRIIWLEKGRDTAGQPTRDNKNPDAVFRQPRCCGLTVLQGLQPAGLDRWNSGSLYNQDDGKTYRISAELRSSDVFVARISRRAALPRDQDLAAGSAAQVGRMVLAPLEPSVAEGLPPPAIRMAQAPRQTAEALWSLGRGSCSKSRRIGAPTIGSFRSYS
jgi:uncharacterized protein (DUF2147 family)